MICFCNKVLAARIEKLRKRMPAIYYGNRDSVFIEPAVNQFRNIIPGTVGPLRDQLDRIRPDLVAHPLAGWIVEHIDLHAERPGIQSRNGRKLFDLNCSSEVKCISISDTALYKAQSFPVILQVKSFRPVILAPCYQSGLKISVLPSRKLKTVIERRTLSCDDTVSGKDDIVQFSSVVAVYCPWCKIRPGHRILKPIVTGLFAVRIATDSVFPLNCCKVFAL